MKQSNNPSRPVDDLGRSMAGMGADGRPAVRTTSADERAIREILLSIETLAARQTWILEQVFLKGQTSKGIKPENII